MQRGGPCSFRFNGRWHDNAEFIDAYDFKHVHRVRKDGLDYLLEQGDVLTVEEREQQKAQAKIEKGREEYADIIKAWDAGIRTAEALAKATDTPRMGINSRIRAAKRLGLLK